MQQASTATSARRLDQLPAPRGLPLLGNLHQIDPPRFHLLLEDWCAELGSPFRIQFGRHPIFVSADPELLQTVLRERPERYRRLRVIESVLSEIGGNGVFSAEGEVWRRQRKLIMQALAAPNFRSFFPAIERVTERLHRRWQRAAARGEVVEMTRELTRYTVDVTTLLAFGEDPNTLEDGGDSIQRHLAKIFPTIESRINAPFPYWRYLRLPRDRDFDRSMTLVRRHVHGLVERARRRMRDQPAERPRNVLEAMLAARDAPDSQLSNEDVFANTLTLLLAGEDTTAHTIAWTLYHLAIAPAWQQRLQAEAARQLGAAPLCREYGMLQQLDLFEAAATEALRLRPIAPIFSFECNVAVELGGVALPAGTAIFFLPRLAMRDEAHFGHAADFRPDRWTVEREQRTLAHDARAWAQFGAGPRVCPGRHLAGMEIRMLLSMLARNFSFELAADAGSIREVLAFAMMPDRMPLRLRPLA